MESSMIMTGVEEIKEVTRVIENKMRHENWEKQEGEKNNKK